MVPHCVSDVCFAVWEIIKVTPKISPLYCLFNASLLLNDSVWHSWKHALYSLICISHMTSNPLKLIWQIFRLLWDIWLDIHLWCLTWRPSAAHTNTAPLWVKVAKTAVGHHQMWHEFVWCAKLRCVGLTAKWEDRGGFKEGTSWASHNENTMSHGLRLSQNDKAQNSRN